MGLTNVQWAAIEDVEQSNDLHELSLKVKNVQLDSSPPDVAPPPQPLIVESEDIFASADTRKRRSAEIVSPYQNQQPGVLRKSPRLQLQEISNSVTQVQKKPSPTKCSNNDSVIAESPVIIQKTQRRTQRAAKPKQTKRVRCQNVENQQPKQTDNPMQNLLIDVDDLDSIGFSDSHSHSSKMHDSHILSITKESDTPVVSLDQLKIVNVSGNDGLFERFCTELRRTNTVGLAVAVGSHISENPQSVIGGNLLINQIAGSLSRDRKKNCTFNGGLQYVAGLSICLAETEPAAAFYLNLQDDDNAAVNYQRKVALLNELFERTDLTVQMFDVREQCKVLATAVPEIRWISGQLEDPRIGNWLLQPDVDANLVEMVRKQIIYLYERFYTKNGFKLLLAIPNTTSFIIVLL